MDESGEAYDPVVLFSVTTWYPIEGDVLGQVVTRNALGKKKFPLGN
jgi:hypothetical protein